MSPSFSIATRALLAVLLMIGFFLLALVVSFALLYVPYAELTYAHRLHFKLAAFCVIGALAILWSVMPRTDKFEAPGPQLARAEHPRLFTEIEAIARSVGQSMPAEVYLVPDVNAWVGQRGGAMGIGSRRVMGLGLPLLGMLPRSQFRAVLAHEFGHYHGGDTRLGPWVYKTRNAIGRTLHSLSGAGGQGSVLQLPFRWYGKMFLRITHAVSRRQEFVADELAARAVGSKPLIDGLRTVHGVAPAFQAFWVNEYAPVLESGFHPPLAEGFEQFVRTERITDAIAKQLDEEMKAETADPYDTHPPLNERIAAVANLPVGEVTADDPPALSLLGNVTLLEDQLMVTLAGAEQAGKLRPIHWSEVCSQVYLPQWTALAKANGSGLSGITPESLPQSAANLKAFGQRFVDLSGAKVEDESAEGMARAVVGAALTILTLNRGGKLDGAPGQAVSVTCGSIKFEPFRFLQSLAERKTTAEAWQGQCAELGILGVDLGKSVGGVV